MRKNYDPEAFERKWQNRWLDSGIWKGEIQPERPKFFLMFAYPGTSGYLHVGHMRGYTYSDVITRYKRMAGFNVLFPVGAHPTGNVVISFSRKIERGDGNLLAMLRSNGCSDDEIQGLKDPERVVRFFGDMYVSQYWKKFGFLADWDRFMTTADPGYMKFIQWQFRKLHERGMLTQKPYYGTACMECGPVAVDASETDISQGGNAEKQEWTILKFRSGDDMLVAATLRPETVFGQTNFWANPDVEYVRARVGGETWILSRQGAEKLSFQKDSVEIIGTVPGRDLIGRTVMAPVIDREIPVLPSRFTSPDYGTGLVTGVPSDAPYDWIALLDLRKDDRDSYGVRAMAKKIAPIPIIESRGWGPNPAVEIVERMGIKNQDDPRLEEATREIYKAGFHTGRMRENCGRFAGKPVMAAKEEVKAMMLEMGVADVMYDLSEPVICRCGAKVVVKQIPDQWFIDYGHAQVKEAAKAHVPKMNIQPQDYMDNMPGILDWFKERACVRLGNWLGTPFPFDDRWTIEPISDSTLYSAYYIVSGHVAAGRLDPGRIGDAFFDHVFLGMGTAQAAATESGAPVELMEDIRKEFLYWYPLDINLGGKEHQTVHFPVFLMNHAAVLPDHLPKGLFVHYWITGKSGKMSKSKGGAESIPGAADSYTIDGLRLYYCHAASPHVDVEWDPESVNNSRKSVERAWNLACELLDRQGGEERDIDLWLESRMRDRLNRCNAHMYGFKLREAANIAYFEIPNDLRWYLRRGGDNSTLMRKAAEAWVCAMAPFTPHMAEELWEMSGHTDLVSIAKYPDGKEFRLDPGAITAEEFLENLLEDISGILNMIGLKPGRICLYTPPAWKYEVQKMMVLEGKDMGAVMKEMLSSPDMKSKSKEISAFASRLMKDMKRFGDGGIDAPGVDNEMVVLKSASGFLEKEYGCPVQIFAPEDPDIFDPGNKSNVGSPGKPAIYVE